MARPVCILESWMPANCGITFPLLDPVINLTCDDDRNSPTVYDARGVFNQQFLDPGGDPNTDAHSVAGQINKALYFDGVDDTITLSDGSNIPYLGAMQDFTIAFWWKCDSPNPLDFFHFVANHVIGVGGLAFFTYDDTIRGRAQFKWDASTHNVIIQLIDPINNDWHHYAMRRYGLTIDIYLDGVSKISDTHEHNGDSITPADQTISLGSIDDVSRFSPGALDDFRLYDRALSQDEITALAAM